MSDDQCCLDKPGQGGQIYYGDGKNQENNKDFQMRENKVVRLASRIKPFLGDFNWVGFS